MNRYLNIKKFSADNMIVILIVLLTFSFNIESLLSIGDLTIPILILLFITNYIYYIKKKKIFKFDISDILILIIIAYIFFNSLLFNTAIDSIKAILMSFIPYFLCRNIIIDEKKYMLMKRVINIISWVIIFELIAKYVGSNEVSYRMSLEGSNSVATGEIIGIFAIINLFDIRGKNNNFFSIFNYIVGILINVVVIGARGATIMILLSSFIIVIFNEKKKVRYIMIFLVGIILYFVFFTEGSILLEKIPQLSRFSIQGIIKDTSIIGSASTIGRSQYFKESIYVIKKNIFGKGVGAIYSHNIFLEFGSALGIVGLIVFSIWCCNIIYKAIDVIKVNTVIVAIFIFLFLYRQTSFAIFAHKSLFIFAALIVNQYRNKKFNMKNTNLK